MSGPPYARRRWFGPSGSDCRRWNCPTPRSFVPRLTGSPAGLCPVPVLRPHRFRGSIRAPHGRRRGRTPTARRSARAQQRAASSRAAGAHRGERRSPHRRPPRPRPRHRVHEHRARRHWIDPSRTGTEGPALRRIDRRARALLDDGSSSFDGEFHHLAIDDLGIRPAQPHVPFLIGGHGRAVVKLAAGTPTSSSSRVSTTAPAALRPGRLRPRRHPCARPVVGGGRRRPRR